MKQIFKKNQVIITALALMLCAAGYLQFSDAGEEGKDGAKDVNGGYYYDMDGLDHQTADGSSTEDTGDGVILNVGALDAEQEETDGALTTGNNTLASGESGAAEEEHRIGDAVMVSTTIQPNFTSNARLEREQRRAQSKETLMELIDSQSISEEQKQSAVETLVNLTTIAEKENAAELLLEAKGFADPIVNIVESEVDVVINAASVSDQQIAQIEDIVMRKTGFEPKDITITAAIQED
jgi:stage III sporulation protein AH